MNEMVEEEGSVDFIRPTQQSKRTTALVDVCTVAYSRFPAAEEANLFVD